MTDRAARDVARLRELGDEPNAIWTPDSAAMFLGVSKAALSKWRSDGGGPKFVKLSKTRVGYRKASLVEWSKEREYQSNSAWSEGIAASGAKSSPEAAK